VRIAIALNVPLQLCEIVESRSPIVCVAGMRFPHLELHVDGDPRIASGHAQVDFLLAECDLASWSGMLHVCIR
jgi:hypothetical protein